MSFKTDRLVALFPEVYAAREGESLLHRVLDALGSELVDGDAAIKDLLKSHWIDYARGGGLDQLAALLGQSRRILPGGTPEGDDTFRPLVKSTVSSFVGGGTVEAVKGAVRAALGLPYDLKLFQGQLAGAPGKPGDALAALVKGLQELVRIEEFSPKSEAVLGNAAASVGGSSATLDLDFTSIEPAPPSIEWTFTAGGGRSLRLSRPESGEGFISSGAFEVPRGATLKLSAAGPGGFSASIGDVDYSSQFLDIDGSSKPRMPDVPAGKSKWIFSATNGAEFDYSTFDASETFDAAAFSVRMAWTRYQPLCFDVIVPYFVGKAVQRIVSGSGYEQRFRIFQGLSLDVIQRVVDRARAAGVRGTVQYSISLPGESHDATPREDQGAIDSFSGLIEHHRTESHDVAESLAAGVLDSATESHDAIEKFAIGGVFNVSVFDGSFAFQ